MKTIILFIMLGVLSGCATTEDLRRAERVSEMHQNHNRKMREILYSSIEELEENVDKLILKHPKKPMSNLAAELAVMLTDLEFLEATIRTQRSRLELLK